MAQVILKELIKTNTQSYQKSDNWNYINYLDTGNLTENVINEIIRLDPNKDKIPSRAKRKVKIGDILYSTVRPNQRHYGYIEKKYDNLLVSTGFVVIEPDKSKVNWKYLYYYLTQDNVISYLQTIAENTVATYPSISPKDIENLLVDFPSLDNQEKIIHILSNYDDLIENNNRRIKILEEMAQKIYKEWFVDFKFPGHETSTFKDSPLDKIPNDWEVIKANNVADIFIGRTPSRKDFDCFTMNCKDRKWISIKDIGLSNAFVFQTSEYLTEDAIIKYNVPIIPKDTVILSFKLTVGKVAITTEAMCSNEAIAQFQIKDKQQLSTNYLYLYLKNFEYSNLGNTSSIGNAINSTIVKNMNILIPQSSILSEFNKSINGIFEQIKNLSIKNENLKQTRDLLLPRLISGQINVENMEIV